MRFRQRCQVTYAHIYPQPAMAVAVSWKKNDLRTIAARCGEELEHYSLCSRACSAVFVASKQQ